MSDPIPLHFVRQVSQFAAEQEATRAAHLAIAAHHDALSTHHRSIAEHQRALADELPQMAQDSAEVAMSVAHHDHNNQAMVLMDDREQSQARDAAIVERITTVEERIGKVERIAVEILDILSRKDVP